MRFLGAATIYKVETPVSETRTGQADITGILILDFKNRAILHLAGPAGVGPANAATAQ